MEWRRSRISTYFYFRIVRGGVIPYFFCYFGTFIVYRGEGFFRLRYDVMDEWLIDWKSTPFRESFYRYSRNAFTGEKWKPRRRLRCECKPKRDACLCRNVDKNWMESWRSNSNLFYSLLRWIFAYLVLWITYYDFSSSSSSFWCLFFRKK